MADEGITFKTFGSGSSSVPAGDQQQAPLGESFAERAAKIKARIDAQNPNSGAPNRAIAIGNAMLENLSNGRAPQSEIPAADYAKMSWGEYLPKVAENLGPSSVEALKGMGNAILNPIETASAIGQIGTGLGSKALDTAGEAVGYGPVLDPAKKAEREAMANALGQSYKGRYGGGEEGEFWKHLAEDPASYLSDAASVVSLGAGSATKLGLLDKASDLGKAAKFAENLDPVQAAINLTGKAATTAGKIPPYLLMGAQSAASGVPLKTLNIAREVGLSGDPAKVDAFMKALKGNPNFTGDTAKALEKAIEEMKEQASNSYMTSAATAFARTQPVDMTAPSAARDTLYNMLNPNTVLSAPVTYKPSDIQAANDALFQIDSALTHPSNAGRTIQELDVIKKNIDNLTKEIANPSLRGRVNDIAASLVNSMSETDPAYGDMMRGWQEYHEQLNNVRKDFGSSQMSDAAKSRKLSRAFNSKYGDEMFSKLEGVPSGQNLRYSIAGDAMNELFGDRANSIIATMGGPVGALAFGATHPGVLAAAVPGALTSSPKLGAYSQYALGKAERAVNEPVGRARGYITAPVSNVVSQVGSAVDDRQGRKSGGRVSSHDAAADQLVRAAERARKGQSAQTQVLLNQSDDAVASALEIANRSI